MEMNREQARTLAEHLVGQMTLEEAAGQLSFRAPAIERLGVPAYDWWNEALHGVARAGMATMFPQAIGMAATFDTDLIRRLGDVASTEGRAKYNAASAHGDTDIYKGLTFWSPNINIFRDPRWGRGQETFGEDPFLTGEMGAAYVRGLQGDGPVMKILIRKKDFRIILFNINHLALRLEAAVQHLEQDGPNGFVALFEIGVTIIDRGEESIIAFVDR